MQQPLTIMKKSLLVCINIKIAKLVMTLMMGTLNPCVGSQKTHTQEQSTQEELEKHDQLHCVKEQIHLEWL